ncbi:MAG TPA: hypothetical protein VFB50_11890 [Chloroflexota bacterium]|nr:hypothetical protein [Chloroflexota bacterium]
MTNIVDGHDLDTQSGRADYRAAGGWVEGNASGGYSYQNTNTGSSGVGGGTQTPTQGATFNTPGAQQVTSPSTPTAQSPTFGDPSAYAKAIQQAVAALNSSDLKAFNEQVREWDAIFGFNQQQFQEGIRQYNQTFGLNEAAVTGTYQGQPTLSAQQIAANYLGTYQGQPTLQAQLQAANLLGTYQGQQTLQAQNQFFNQQLATAQLASSLQANPFRQAQVLGQASRLLGGQPVAGFQAPNVVAGVGTAGGNTQGGLGYLQQMADDIRNPVPNQTTADQFIANTPTPNKIDSTSFLRSAPSTQNIVLQAMQEKYGLDPADSLKQIQNTLPQFTAPTTFGGVRR